MLMDVYVDKTRLATYDDAMSIANEAVAKSQCPFPVGFTYIPPDVDSNRQISAMMKMYPGTNWNLVNGYSNYYGFHYCAITRTS